MKKQIALLALAATALIAAPATIYAQDAAATTPAATPAPKKHGAGVHGAVVAVDATAQTVTVGTKTYNVTSDTKITKAGQPATLSDITVGETVSIGYKKDEAGKLNATTIHVGAKKKKKAE